MGFRELGFPSYLAYLDSPHWKTFRDTYRKSRCPQRCTVCNFHLIELHHVTYERLGRERFNDVVPLCRDHHDMVHAGLSGGNLPVEKSHDVIRELRKTIPLPPERTCACGRRKALNKTRCSKCLNRLKPKKVNPRKLPKVGVTNTDAIRRKARELSRLALGNPER